MSSREARLGLAPGAPSHMSGVTAALRGKTHRSHNNADHAGHESKHGNAACPNKHEPPDAFPKGLRLALPIHVGSLLLALVITLAVPHLTSKHVVREPGIEQHDGYDEQGAYQSEPHCLGWACSFTQSNVWRNNVGPQANA